jgi:hypothetical protein
LFQIILAKVTATISAFAVSQIPTVPHRTKVTTGLSDKYKRLKRRACLCQSLSIVWKVGFLKVSKFQKQILLFSFEPKNEQNYFLIFALASKTDHIKKIKALYYIN